MAYRDDLDAARARAEALAQQVERLTTERAEDDREAEALRDRLGKAERELVRLQGLTGQRPPRSMRVWNAALGIAGCLAIATVVAGSQSESDGVSVSYLAGLAFGVAFGGRWRGVWGAALGGVLALLVLGGFYATIWPSL